MTDSIDLRLARARRRMTPGDFGGRSRVASPQLLRPRRVEAQAAPPEWAGTYLATLSGLVWTDDDDFGSWAPDATNPINWGTWTVTGSTTGVQVPDGEDPGAVGYVVSSPGLYRATVTFADDSAWAGVTVGLWTPELGLIDELTTSGGVVEFEVSSGGSVTVRLAFVVPAGVTEWELSIGAGSTVLIQIPV